MTSQELAAYSSGEEIDDDFHPPSNKRRRGEGITWSKVQIFSLKQGVEAAIKSEKMWRKRKQYVTDLGLRAFYDCKFSRECPAKVSVLYDSSSQNATLYKTQSPHDHGESIKNGLSEELESKIDEFVLSGIIKPKHILKNLRSGGLPEPKKNQIVNYLCYKRKNNTESKMVSLGDISRICKDKAKIPEDPDEPFVLNHAIHIDENSEKHTFGFFITTNRYIALWSNYDGKQRGINFSEMYICKHNIGIAIIKKYLTVPEEAKAIPIGQKRKRGRPAHSKKALIIQ